MARLAFFTESLPSHNDPIARFSYDLIRSLADQQHEIRVFSTYRPEADWPPDHPRIEVLRPFRRWGWLELPKVIPLLAQFQPDVMHIIQPRHESLEGLTNAMSLLPGLSSLSGRPVVITSYYDLDANRLKAQRMLFFASDAITVSNRPQAELVEHYVERSGHQPTIRILPIPGASNIESTPQPMSESLQEFFGRYAKVIVIPGEIEAHRDLENLFAQLTGILSSDPESAVLFAGGWGKISTLRRRRLMRAFESKFLGPRVMISGPLSEDAKLFCLKSAYVVFIASLPLQALEVADVMRQALATSSVLLMNSDQAALDPLHWLDRENAFITTNRAEAWRTKLSESLNSGFLVSRIRSQLPEFTRTEVLDRPGNVMSRIYSDVLAQKRR